MVSIPSWNGERHGSTLFIFKFFCYRNDIFCGFVYSPSIFNNSFSCKVRFHNFRLWLYEYDDVYPLPWTPISPAICLSRRRLFSLIMANQSNSGNLRCSETSERKASTNNSRAFLSLIPRAIK